MAAFHPTQIIKNLSRQSFEQACMQHKDHVYVGNKTILCNVLTKYKMYVDATDYTIAPHLLMDGYWESWVTLLLGKIIEPGMTCVDIGANFGYFSLLMSGLAGSKGRTISIEANPQVSQFLRATKVVNGHSFELVEVAVSDKRGEAVLTVTEHEHGGGTIQPNEMIPGRKQVKVSMMPLDDILAERNISKVDVIKMDVEGVEPLAFAGMKKTMEANPQLQIVTEYTPSIYRDPLPFTEYLFDTFTVYQIRSAHDVVPLERSSIPELLKLIEHIDLYLLKKGTKANLKKLNSHG
jgi:FkbM family methyltransferase